MAGQSTTTSPERRLTGPYRGVVVALAAAAIAVAAGGVVAAVAFAWAYVLDAAVVLAVAGAALVGIAAANMPAAPPKRRFRLRIEIRAGQLIACAGLVLAALDAYAESVWRISLSPVATIAAASACVLAAGAAGLVVHYFGTADVAALPEAPALQRGARVAAWLLVLVAGQIGALRFDRRAIAGSLHAVVLAIVALACVELFAARRAGGALPVDLRVLAALGRRANPFASLLDTAQDELGIDLRSTWALTVARRFAQPLVLALCVLGWLSTAVTVVATDEVGLVERFGTVVDGPALAPGIHVHWPWPIDRVRAVGATRVRAVAIGHDGAPAASADVLWARQHSANEYTQLLGDGRDLITFDAEIQYRIRDPRAYVYSVQNPDDALKAIGFRAVMRATVSRTLDAALSENVATLTESIRKNIAADADQLGLGVDIVGFTIGGMHPPVEVAPDYEAVVSAQLAKVTAIVNAQADRNRSVPAADAAALVETTAAQADAAAAIAKAASDAWSFRTLESQYRPAPDEYRFRRRLEALEQVLGNRHFTVVDARIMRDGGELWLTQ